MTLQELFCLVDEHAFAGIQRHPAKLVVTYVNDTAVEMDSGFCLEEIEDWSRTIVD